jgi:hypothetical protein
MRKGDVDRFFRQVASQVKYPIKIYLTGGIASWFMGGDRPTEDIDFGLKTTAGKWREVEKIIQEVSRQLAIPVQFSEDIGRWGMVGASDYEKKAKQYRKFGKVVVYLLSVPDWSIGKISRYYQSDVDDLRHVLKSQKTSSSALLKCWSEALLNSPRSSASGLFIKTVEDFLKTYGKEVWGSKFDPHESISFFQQLLRT